MASSSRIFSRSLRFARSVKMSSSKVQSATSSLHVTNSARKLSNSQLARPLASVCGLLNSSSKCSLKSNIQFTPQQTANVSIIARSAAFLGPASQGSDESSVSTSEGSDSSCEAMEGPHGDDNGLVITKNFTAEDL